MRRERGKDKENNKGKVEQKSVSKNRANKYNNRSF